MLANERHNKILNVLDIEGNVKSSKLIKILDVSLETIRRDLDNLEKLGLLKKVHGGAIPRTNRTNSLPYRLREDSKCDEKKSIANKALEYIFEGDTIALNGGTTNIEIAKLLKIKYKNLTVVTNSILIANELIEKNGINLILVGGIYNKREFSFLGENTLNALNKFSVDKSFVGVGGVSLKRGVTDFLEEEVQIEKKFIEIANEIIILADSSKIGINSLIKVCNLEDVNLIITDSKLDINLKKKFLTNGIEIIN
jgi:DeoR/GlpR family transcriptional regulator of sugar metabolism